MSRLRFVWFLVNCPLVQLDRSFRALQYAGAAGDALLLMVKVNHVVLVIRRPAPNGTDRITLEDALTLFGVKVDLQVAQGFGDLPMFNDRG